ncbi:unnamed protein product, partial [Brenthis ino]
MKSKKRHHDSSDESEESDASVKSSSSSESDSDDSSISEARHKKKRKRADSSDSDSNTDDQRRAKKRKHKKKKKKHTKKKRRSESYEDVSDDAISISEGEISPKKRRKHKHKHSKRTQSGSEDGEYEKHSDRRLHSVVKERRTSSEEGNPPSRTYYQKEYHRSGSVEEYDHGREGHKYYQEPSRRHHEHQDSYNYERGRNDRYPQQEDRYDRQRDKYASNAHFVPNEEGYSGRQREYEEYKRHPRYEEHLRGEDHYRRDREVPYQPREDTRGTNRYNRYEDRAPKRREFEDGRDYRERRGPAEPDRYRDKEFEKRERFSPERGRDVRRERPARVEKVAPVRRDPSRSRSEEERYREKTEEKRERSHRPPDDRRVSVDRRTADRRAPDDRRPDKSDDRRNKPRERKSRFDNENDKKEYSWGKTDVKDKDKDKEGGDKEKPNFGLSGKLTADANTVNGVVIKYTEPDDAKQPKRRWRFYPFKGDKALPILYIHRQSCFLIGRDKKVVDIALEHPSISKQHAALQYRATPFTRADGSQGRRVRPYIIDLESANGTFVNNKKLDPRRYVELLERDVVKFGFSQRERQPWLMEIKLRILHFERTLHAVEDYAT